MDNKKHSKPKKIELSESAQLFQDIQQLIVETRAGVATTVNAGLTLLYWRVGERIRREVLLEERAEYGKQILQTVSAKLTSDYGRGWSERNLAYMVRFAEVFPKIEILQTLFTNLSWSHFKDIVYIDDPLKREFYAEMCRVEGWSVRTLRKKLAACCMSARRFQSNRTKSLSMS